MAARPPKETKQNAVVLDGAVLTPALGVSDPGLAAALAQQLAVTLWIPGGVDAQERMDAAIAALKGIAPSGELEGMLAVQMVATHSAAMECLRRAALAEQTFAARDMNLKHATKMLTLYARQMEALDRHRGRGQQKITVEHVTVNAGGHAIVGAVEAPRGAATTAALPAPEATPMPLLDLEAAPVSAPVARRG